MSEGKDTFSNVVGFPWGAVPTYQGRDEAGEEVRKKN